MKIIEGGAEVSQEVVDEVSSLIIIEIFLLLFA